MKRIIMISSIVLIGGAAYVFAAIEGLTPEKLREILFRWQGAAPAIFVAMHTLRPLTLLPSSLLVFLASLYFDFWTGLMLNIAGLFLNMSLAYFLGKYLGHEWLKSKFPASKKVIMTLNSGSWPLLASVRMVPIFPADLVSYTCGVCSISYLPYITGSVVGSIPGLTVVMAAGTGIRGGELLHLLPLSLIMILLAIWAWRKIIVVRWGNYNLRS
ncbi:TVP38/TMEM64 family protein [Natranaerobius thermophilus]|uniref:TVP38/TMEM64 family membrane protein n=1 Tax=Natranaerobius thermophilus (strain ATCC BAA-1301 / DSM 18059 / JW/NM-WN-LF) TaxID=457570 RepID=B2A8I1_NATTJ|nr:VTT domain-containing protein [Natranaerobius thermophilus]ACB85865.1 SNARE associated Golgi protein [Natranaerobius thermophilus JW/NM-WN-LF]